MSDALTSPLSFGLSAAGSEEQAQAVLRLKNASLLAAVAWPLFAAFDVAFDAYAWPGSLRTVLLIRLVEWLLIVGCAVAARSRLAHKYTSQIIFALHAPAAFALSAMAIPLGDLVSPYAFGIALVIIARTITLAQPWWQSWRSILLIVSSYPLTMLAAAPFNEALRAQLGDGRTVSHFLFACGVLLCAGVFLAVISHTSWSLRQQLFAAKNLGRYRLTRKIGQGGMGEVWAAHHAALKRDVAVKLLKLDRDADSTSAARFLREVQATSELDHPNTIRIFDFGATDDGFLYYVMELLDGLPLSAIIRNGGAQPVARAVHLIKQPARALAEAHRRGIVHRDVKPDNLFVTVLGGEPDVVKLLDFGLARLERPDAADLTAEGMVAGTPSYISPEAASGLETDARSDVYSLCATLYVLLSGRRPFENKNKLALIAAARSEVPARPSRKLGHPLPSELEALVMRGLEKDPAARFMDAGALLAALEACPDVPDWTPGEAAEAWAHDLELEREVATKALPAPSARPDETAEMKTIAASPGRVRPP